MSPADTGRSTDAATVAHPAGQPSSSRPGGGDTFLLEDPALRTDPWPPPVLIPARVGLTGSADHPYDDPLGPLVKDGRHCAAPRTGNPRSRRPVPSENKRLSAGMTAALSAELEGRVARDLVADIVRAILDESRQSAQDRAVESMMIEARQRLERIIRARTSG